MPMADPPIASRVDAKSLDMPKARPISTAQEQMVSPVAATGRSNNAQAAKKLMLTGLIGGQPGM